MGFGMAVNNNDKKIPKGWKLYKFIDIAEIIGGGTPSKNNPDFWNGNIDWLTVADFNTGRKYIRHAEQKITQLGLEKSSTKILKKGQIIISARGTVGAIAVLAKDMAFNQSNYGINAKDNITFNDFVYYLLKYKINELKQASYGAVFDTITKATFENLEILLPPLHDQKAIASVLSSLDDKIDLLHRENKTLEKMAETLFRKWFIEDAKEDWEEVKLGDILKVIESGKRPKGGINPTLKKGIPSIGAESINGIGNFDFSNTKYISEEFFSSIKKGIVKDYDVLIYKDGAYIGKKAMFGLGFPFDKFAVNEHVFILRSNEKANQFFLYFLLNKEDLAMLNSNSAQPGLNQKSIINFEIVLPDKDLITKFGDIVKVYIDKILTNSKQIRTLYQMRDALLPKLMIGEIRLKF